MTGPPGLGRNGGIWKLMKRGLGESSNPARLMVQAIHFASYTLSDGAWEDWNQPWYGKPRLSYEIERTFGPTRDLFVDSGGFQLLHRDKIDLSRWGLAVEPEDILSLQLRYSPTRLVSLDTPIGPYSPPGVARQARRVSIENAVWLTHRVGLKTTDPTPYLAIHGRTSQEVSRYLDRLKREVGPRWWRQAHYGLALGSQVPLSGDPDQVVSNVNRLLRWASQNCPADTPVHIFGVGDGIVGRLLREGRIDREIGYDNSTYVQSAYRMKVYDPLTYSYREYAPGLLPECECFGCKRLREIGDGIVFDVLSRPAYCPVMMGMEKLNRSDVLALVALHNLHWWRHRVSFMTQHRGTHRLHPRAGFTPTGGDSYSFPLRQFTPKSPNLLLLPCSKGRPYSLSRSQRRVLSHLEDEGFDEGSDFDRVTVSGLYGPVHWVHETHPSILGYDFPLTRLVSQGQIDRVRLRLGSTLNVIGKRYSSVVAYFKPPAYADAFGALAKSFGVKMATCVHDICLGFAS